jgi:hypothetical protein
MKLPTAILLASTALTVLPAHAALYTQDYLTPPTGFRLGWHDGTEGMVLRHLVIRHPLSHRHRHHRAIAHKRASMRVRAAGAPLPKSRSKLSGGGFYAAVPAPLRDFIGSIVDGVTLGLDRAYLVATSRPGSTMERQGPALAIGRLNPIFAHRLAGAIREARAVGIEAAVFSAYRPPGYGIGGFRDKFDSAHAYGLAVDMCGIGGPGSHIAIRWREIAAKYGVYGPYSVYSRSEWNHMEPSMSQAVTRQVPALRRTITAAGPKALAAMWNAAAPLIARIGLAANVGHAQIARFAEHRRVRRIKTAIRARYRRWRRRHRYARVY